MPEYISDNMDIFSDSGREYSNEESSNEEKSADE